MDKAKKLLQTASETFMATAQLKQLYSISGGMSEKGKNFVIRSKDLAYIPKFKLKKLKKLSRDISTIHDVDICRYQKAYKGGMDHIPSRFDALKELYGEEKADGMLRNLEVGSWDLRKKTPHYRGPKLEKASPPRPRHQDSPSKRENRGKITLFWQK